MRSNKRERMFCVFYGDNWEWPREFTFPGINKARACLDCSTSLTSGVKGNKLLFAVPAKTQQTSHHLEIRVFEISQCVQISCLPGDETIIFVHFRLFFYFFFLKKPMKNSCQRGTSKPNNCWPLSVLGILCVILSPQFCKPSCFKSWSRRLALLTSHSLEAPFAASDHCSSADAAVGSQGWALSNYLLSLVFMFSFTLFEPKHFHGFASTYANSWIPRLLFWDL